KLIPRMNDMKLLHIDSSVLGPHSVSRQVSAAIVERLRRTTPGLEVVYRDLTSTPLSHLSGSHLAVAQGAAPEAALQQHLTGVQVGPEHREKALAGALQAATNLQAA